MQTLTQLAPVDRVGLPDLRARCHVHGRDRQPASRTFSTRMDVPEGNPRVRARQTHWPTVHLQAGPMSEVRATIQHMTESRPTLDQHLSGLELQRWYWLRGELAAFARSLGVSARGGKQELTTRLVAQLDHGTPPPPAPHRRPRPLALREPLTAATPIPSGQRCTQQLRHYFTAVLGPSFSFDAVMRDFITHGEGRTLGDALTHWRATRSRPPSEIGSQFELNAFIRDWHHRHPRGTHAQALKAWRNHRDLPVDARPTPEEGTP